MMFNIKNVFPLSKKPIDKLINAVFTNVREQLRIIIVTRGTYTNSRNCDRNMNNFPVYRKRTFFHHTFEIVVNYVLAFYHSLKIVERKFRLFTSRRWQRIHNSVTLATSFMCLVFVSISINTKTSVTNELCSVTLMGQK